MYIIHRRRCWPPARELIAKLEAPRAVALNEKLWLTLEEAAEYAGLGRAYLHDSCVSPDNYQEGQNLIGVRGGPHGALRIRRASLEAFAG